MKTIRITVAGQTVIVLAPEGAAPTQALWLIPPKGETAEVWLEKTSVKDSAETAKALLVCAPGAADDGFYTEALWDALFAEFPGLSREAGARRLLGLWESAERCLRFTFAYPEKFSVAVAVSPVSADGGAALLELVKAHMSAGRAAPRTVISDSAEGEGRALGDAINAYGVGLHVHAERPVSGWALMDAEIKSCLAHL